MKQSTFSGEHIYKSIRNKLEELKQYDVALKELEDRGTQYKPYVLLKKERDKVEVELYKMYGREWK